MSFTKLIISMDHVTDDRIEETYRRWLRADSIIGDPKAIERMKEYEAQKLITNS